MSHLLAVLHAQYSHVRRREWCGWSSDRAARKKCTQRFRDKSSVVMKTFRILTGCCHARSLIDALEFPQQCTYICRQQRRTFTFIGFGHRTFTTTQSYRESLGFFRSNVNCKTVSLCLSSQHRHHAGVKIRRENVQKLRFVSSLAREKSSKAPSAWALRSLRVLGTLESF